MLNQAHNIGTIGVLEDAVTISILGDSQVQHKVFCYGFPSIWCYSRNDASWRRPPEWENRNIGLHKNARKEKELGKELANGQIRVWVVVYYHL